MTKFANKDVTRRTHRDKKQIRRFRKNLIINNEIAKLIGKLKLLYFITDGKNLKISYIHQDIEQSPYRFKVILNVHNLLSFYKDK